MNIQKVFKTTNKKSVGQKKLTVAFSRYLHLNVADPGLTLAVDLHQSFTNSYNYMFMIFAHSLMLRKESVNEVS